MLRYFYPDEYVDSIYQIDYKSLKRKKIDTLFIDIDNTLVPHYVPEAPRKLIIHFNMLKDMGFKICLLSNNNKKRVRIFNESINLELSTIHRARKPSKVKIKNELKKLNSKSENTCIIGDQVFTDVWSGKILGFYTILIKQVVSKDEFFVVFKRFPEKIVLDRFLKDKETSRK